LIVESGVLGTRGSVIALSMVGESTELSFGVEIMRRLLVLALTVALFSPAAFATDLNVWVVFDDSDAITVGPSCPVPYTVKGVLSDELNEGLALVGFDLSFSGGVLDAADVPTEGSMANFVGPVGINNPDDDCPPKCGYAGTLIGGDLVQVGGGQNSIKNTEATAPFPLGDVIVGVGYTEIVLVTGMLTAPEADGVYTLTVQNGFANVIMEGETGEEPQNFWKTETADVVVTGSLTITVETGAECPGACTLVASDPPNCAVDARLPHHLDDNTIVYGWESITLEFDCTAAATPPSEIADYTVTVESGDPPTITSVVVDGSNATLNLDEPIPAAQWTCFSLAADAAQQTCLGYLPGDADADLTAAPADILRVIDCLNEVAVCEIWQCDIDRDNDCAPADILRVIDLLNGASELDPWLDESLSACPSL
jgi:hypothetical protein